MARTKASVGAKVASGKSSKARCSVAPPSSSAGSSGSDKSRSNSGGGNPVCHRETPKWQKPITNFFICNMEKEKTNGHESDEEVVAGSSKPNPKRNVIQSDSEDDETPKNSVLDESIHLEPLTGEDSHKLEEYYPKGKGKGVGKKTKDKENIDTNVSERKSLKRDLDDVESDRLSKKVKVN